MIKKPTKKKKLTARSTSHKSTKPKGRKVVKKSTRKTTSKIGASGISRRLNPSMPAFESTPFLQARVRNANLKRIAYYAMGAIALGSGLLVLGYEAYKTNRAEQLAKTSALIGAPHMTQDELAKAFPVEGAESRIGKKKLHKSVFNSSNNTDTLSSEFSQVHGMSMSEKIQFWSDYLEKDLAARKKVSALAKDIPINDTAPLVADKYNCTTYVETVVALAKSEFPEQFVKNLISVRYLDGQPGFTRRNHFPEADWIPNNEKAEILTDITNRISEKVGITAKVESKLIDREKWLVAHMRRHPLARSLASVRGSEWTKPVEVHVSYIEISKVKQILNEIPNGTVLNLVHQNNDRHPVLITHQGFVIREGGRVFLRHAATGGVIRTSELYPYLRELLNQKSKNLEWPLIGVNLNQINDSTSESNFLRQVM